MKSPFSSLWRMALAALLSIFLMVVIANVITQPVENPTRTFSADFTDVSGLHEGADVRVRGVRVGKVVTLAIKRVDGRSLAQVGFTMDDKFGIATTSRLAVKFQALTGLRFLDVANPNEGNPAVNQIDRVPTAMTQPSFDITVLFNGLQPVLATIKPEDINRFTDNVAAFLNGDGDGLGPMLDSINTLTELVSNREQVIDTLINNVGILANAVTGRSSELIKLLRLIQIPIDSGMTVLDEFRKSQIYGPTFVNETLRLLDATGIKPGINIEDALDRAYTNVYDAIEGVKRIPVVWENIQPPPVAGNPAPCSKGQAQLPLPVDVLLNGRKVVLCNS